jgi:undecaprenyl-phosphate 4-deoxy-4-formamido-L-arabinose transferase
VEEIISVVSQKPEYSYEIICVNDGSTDNVLFKLKSHAENNINIMAVDLAKNMGKHAAVMAGYSFVTGEYIVNLDDDGQCPLDRLWDLLRAVEQGSDIATAKYVKKEQSMFKNFCSDINLLMSCILLDKPRDIRFENFSVVRRFVIDDVLKYNNPYPYLEGLFWRTTNIITALAMEERQRSSGVGNFTLKKSLKLWLNGFTAFSVKPLRLASIFGFICAALGFILGVILILRKILQPLMPMGYASTMTLLLFIGGVIMAMLGLLGEYVGRIYISINNSPQYVIRDVFRK